MEEKKGEGQPGEDEGSLESLETADDGVIDATKDTPSNAQLPKSAPKSSGLKAKLSKFNLYLVLFGLILVLGCVIVTIAYLSSKKAEQGGAIQSGTLSQDSLQKLATSDSSVGDPQQVLNVQSNAVFAGKVLVRSSLDVAGDIQLGGTLTLANITVNGTGTFATLQASKDFSASGDAAIQGQVSVGKNLQVSGSGSFSGPITAPQVTTSNFQLNSDLVLTHHISAGGPQPSRMQGSAVGSGGTASVSGSDTSGSITVNTGTSAAAGCYITVTFAAKYNSVPKVIISPVGSDATKVDYYINKSTSGFSVCASNATSAGLSFGFDYFVVE